MCVGVHMHACVCVFVHMHMSAWSCMHDCVCMRARTRACFDTYFHKVPILWSWNQYHKGPFSGKMGIILHLSLPAEDIVWRHWQSSPLHPPPTPLHVYLCDVVWHRAWVPIICVSPCGTNVSKLLTFFFFHSRPLSSVVVNVVLTWTSFQFIKSKTRFDWNHSWEGLD